MYEEFTSKIKFMIEIAKYESSQLQHEHVKMIIEISQMCSKLQMKIEALKKATSHIKIGGFDGH